MELAGTAERLMAPADDFWTLAGGFTVSRMQSASRQPGPGGTSNGEVPKRPTEATRIYLARHGRTQLNADGLLRGHLDPDLDPIGSFQASALGDVVGRQPLQLVVSSPLKRAVETARAVADRAGLGVEVDQRLIDRDYGSWAGTSKKETITRWGSLDDAPGVEPASQVLARALDAITDICRSVDGGAALVVSHDVVNRLVLGALDPCLDDTDRVPQDTGCFNVLEYREDGWSVRSINNAPGGHDDMTELDTEIKEPDIRSAP